MHFKTHHLSKWILFISMSLLLALSAISAHAQSRCLPLEYQQRNATHIYLIRLTKVGHVPMGGNEYAQARIDTRGARFEVLKVYMGDIERLKGVENAMIEIQCDNSRGLNCRILEEKRYPFKAGQMYIVYDNPDEDGLLPIKMNACPSTRRYIANENVLADFEDFNPPLWESSVWLTEHGISEEVIDPELLGEQEASETLDVPAGNVQEGVSNTSETKSSITPIELPKPMMP